MLVSRVHALLLSLFFLNSVFAQTQPADTGSARRDGRSQGESDGRRDGYSRGRSDGDREGQAQGYRDGFARCEAIERQRAYDSGYSDGSSRGNWEGDSEGRRRGDNDGQSQGRSDGQADGDHRADNDAEAAATPPGRQLGREQAEASDAREQGRADGIVAGDRAARAQALAYDYPLGHSDYKAERFREAIVNRDAFSQIAPAPLFEEEVRFGIARALQVPRLEAVAGARCNYPTSEENSACQDGYNDGYRSAYDSEYRHAYRSAYDGAFRSGADRGCYDAQSRSYSGDRDRGYNDGYRAAYDRAYQSAYRRAYDAIYPSAFRQASDETYRAVYRSYYDAHFEAARAAAYRARYDALYEAAYEAAKAEKYAEVYPGYAAQEYARGRADEAADFAARPVRLLESSLIETIPNGVYEPGEAIRFRVQLRNFADAGLLGRDVRVTVRAADAANTVVAQGEAVLARDLRNKSLTDVSDLLEVRFNESAAAKATHLLVAASYQGRAVGEIRLDVTPQFMVDVKLADEPVFQEGMETAVRLLVRNRSETPTNPGLGLRIASPSEKLEILTSEVNAGVLAPGASGVFEFRVIAHTGGNTLQVPITFGAILGGGRRVGLLETNKAYPVRNDFRVLPTSDLSTLRNKGVTRVSYKITNIGSTDQFKGLQLKVSVLGPNRDKFQVVGPNPQFLPPMDRGIATTFVVPLLAKEKNTGGKVQIEIQEDGKTVVVHQAAF